jgi:hypothetical protein
MNVKHFDCLSWFSEKCESHKQDGETLSAQPRCDAASASGDPAMAFGPSLGMNGQRPIPWFGSIAAGCRRQLRCRFPDGSSAAIYGWQLRCRAKAERILRAAHKTRGTSRA